MKAKIERIFSEEDFIGVYELYNGEKSIRELKWLFSDLNNKGEYNALVAKNEFNKIVGVVAYQSSSFIENGQEIVGITQFSWKISASIKGMHGLRLSRKVYDYGDFSYALGGTKTALKLMPMNKFSKIGSYTKFYKILNLSDYSDSLKIVSFKKRVGFLGLLWPSLLDNRAKRMLYKDLIFKKYENNFIPPKDGNNIFQKKITQNYLEWLLRCPNLDSYAFIIKKEDLYLGTCVLYIQKVNGINIGRIVHLPFLGYDSKIWASAIDKCLTFFKMEKCAMVSGIASHEMNMLGFKNAGFIGNRLTSKPIFVRDVNQILKQFKIDSWFLQFSEGDEPYLGF